MDSRSVAGSRVASIDALRGAVMIVMALDHVRDFFHVDASVFSPTDLSRTSAVLFLTRWITHFCLPVFVFTAGAGAFLWQSQKHRSNGELARFLWTRGLWFVLLELTVMQLAYNFRFSSQLQLFLLVLWIFGICMLLMAGLVYLPKAWLLTFSLCVIALHNLLDKIPASRFGADTWVWNLVHQAGLFRVGGRPVLVPYPILPWIGVMTAGFCFGQIFLWEPAARRRFVRRVGLSLVVAFVALRAVNHYGDPAPWAFQKSAIFTVLSFLNCTKNPGSFDYLLMTLGPALLVLSYLDGYAPDLRNPLMVFGRVPLFYFVLHFYLIHALSVLMAWVRYGRPALTFMFNPPLSMGGAKQLFPTNYGYSLAGVYVIWICVVAALYPVCRWFAAYKSGKRSWWLSYL